MNCPKCGGQVFDTYFFCPFCGKQVKDKPLSTSFLKQIGLYIFAFFFPPFGLIPAYKYVKQNNEKTRVVGSILVIITVLSLVLTIWASMSFIDTFNKTFKAQFDLQQNTILP